MSSRPVASRMAATTAAVDETVGGSHLANAASAGLCELYYWRDRNREVDFVVRSGDRLVAIEVKSGRAPRAQPGIDAFANAHRPSRVLLVGAGGIDIGRFLSTPVTEWL